MNSKISPKQFLTMQLTNLQLMKAIIIINGESYLAILHTPAVIFEVAGESRHIIIKFWIFGLRHRSIPPFSGVKNNSMNTL